jgi:hypothetical protein
VRLLPRIAGAGLGLAIVTGALLFTVQPQDYASNRAFLAKAALVGTGAAHALYLRRTEAWCDLANGGAVDGYIRASAALSLVLWTAAIVAGRFIAY